MKKGLILLGFSCLLFLGIGTGAIVTAAEGEEPVKTEVIIDDCEHGTVKVDKTEGEVGDIITINAEPDIFYIIDGIYVNGTALIESSTVKGEYSFALVEGTNLITTNFVIDSELLGEFTGMFQEMENKDWAHLFSVENVIRIIFWFIDGGLLVAMIRYFVKDKRLEKKLEDNVANIMNEIVPDTTKTVVVDTVEKVMTPIVTNLQGNMTNIEHGMVVFAKCMALAQENTPESRKAIIDELSGLNISDKETLLKIKKFIEDTVAKALEIKEDRLKAIEEIEAKNAEIIKEKEEKHSEEEVEPTYDGTSI